MDNSNKKVVARIQDVEYTLIGTVDQKHIDDVSKMVDEMINDVKKANPLANKNMVYILSCMNFATEIMSLKQSIERLEEKVKSIEDVNDLKEQLLTYKEYSKHNSERINELKQERDLLKKQLEKYRETVEKSEKKLKQYKYNIEESRKTILELQNQLFESQMELVKSNKSAAE